MGGWIPIETTSAGLPVTGDFSEKGGTEAEQGSFLSKDGPATPQNRVPRLPERRDSASVRWRKDWSWMKAMKVDKSSAMEALDSQHRSTSLILSRSLPHPSPRNPRPAPPAIPLALA